MADKKKQKPDEIEALQKEIKQDAGDEIESASEDEVVSARKVVYAEIDDEITSIYDKIHNVKASDVYVVIPKRAAIFQSIVNLKILKRKAESLNKKVYFVTNDKNGTYLANEVGITVYDRSSDGKPSLFYTDVNDEKLRITPLKATVNSVDEDTPTRVH